MFHHKYNIASKKKKKKKEGTVDCPSLRTPVWMRACVRETSSFATQNKALVTKTVCCVFAWHSRAYALTLGACVRSYTRAHTFTGVRSEAQWTVNLCHVLSTNEETILSCHLCKLILCTLLCDYWPWLSFKNLLSLLLLLVVVCLKCVVFICTISLARTTNASSCLLAR